MEVSVWSDGFVFAAAGEGDFCVASYCKGCVCSSARDSLGLLW